tara:strand:+ start:54 stop:689 length:636 start_codon:yes stop_codon:yes gene_type:complete
MKKLLVLLFSIFLLSSPTVFADDISDFEIEGISIGDSLLDYMTEDEILLDIEQTKNHYSYLNEPNKYAEVYSNIKLDNNFTTFDYLSFYVKNNETNNYITNKNEKFTILGIRGIIRYVEDFESCMQKRDEIVEILSKMFPNEQKTKVFFEHALDPSGNSFVYEISFAFDLGGEIEAECIDFEETFRIKNSYTEGLTVGISYEEIKSWLSDY